MMLAHRFLGVDAWHSMIYAEMKKVCYSWLHLYSMFMARTSPVLQLIEWDLVVFALYQMLLCCAINQVI